MRIYIYTYCHLAPLFTESPLSLLSQDAYSLQSQQRTAAAQKAGKFDDEIVPMDTVRSSIYQTRAGQ